MNHVWNKSWTFSTDLPFYNKLNYTAADKIQDGEIKIFDCLRFVLIENGWMFWVLEYKVKFLFFPRFLSLELILQLAANNIGVSKTCFLSS